MVPRILIADDQEVVLKGLRAVLECDPRFAVCAVAMNGAEAVIKAEELRPDLIILDLAMPIMNGLEAARKITSILPGVPILLYTLSDTEQIRLDAANAGIRTVVSKSAGTEFLFEAIEKALTKEIPAVPQAGVTELPLVVTSLDEATTSAEPLQTDSSNPDPSETS
jgi:DNA-binding NarL/FixJ family response regulator